MASKIDGLYQRGGKFWLRVIAPKDLQAAYYSGKRIAFNGTLSTSDPQVARVAATAKRADMEAQFLRQRRELSPPKLASVAPELRRCIVDTLLAQEVAADAAQRTDKTRSTSVHRAATVAYANDDGSLPELPAVESISPLRPLAPEVVATRSAFNLRRQQVVRAALASGNLEVMLPLVKPIAQRLGLAIDYESADGVQLLQDALAAYMQARDVAVQRDEGKVVLTPSMPAVPAEMAQEAQNPAKGNAYLRDIKADWLALKIRQRPAIKIMERALKLMGEAGIDVPLAELDRQHGARLRAGSVLRELLMITIDIASSIKFYGGVVALVVVPQFISWILSGLFGCAGAPILVGPTFRFFFWSIVKSFVVAAGVILAAGGFGWAQGWDGVSATKLIMLSGSALVSLAASFTLIYYFRDLDGALVPASVPSPSAVKVGNALRGINAWMNRRIT